MRYNDADVADDPIEDSTEARGHVTALIDCDDLPCR
jgi:hypothetical protein